MRIGAVNRNGSASWARGARFTALIVGMTSSVAALPAVAVPAARDGGAWRLADATAVAVRRSLPAMVTEGLFLDPPAPARQQQEQRRGRGDDLARIRRWRSFLDRASRAFFAAQMNTAAVKSKIDQADKRIAELEDAPADDPGGRVDITADVDFLERADRAFTAAHMDTAAVKRWLAEAKEGA